VTNPGETPQPSSAGRPQTLALTFLGNAVLGRHLAVSSGSFVSVLARLGIAEQATRSTLTRLVNRGMLSRHARGRKTYFGLTPEGTRVLREGEHRLWHTGAVNHDDDPRWTLLGFSFPESRRDERHVLRSRLRWAGFGLLRSGMWIAPGIVDVGTILPNPRLLDHIVVFHAEPAEPADVKQMVQDAYDLQAIADRYQQFLHRWGNSQPLPAAPDDLARNLLLISEWLVLLRDDPRIPLRHLPADWPAAAAQTVFLRQHQRLQPTASRIADSVIDSIELSPQG
jgi:phenylacetic acid degradation operon negative regulatory protein